MALNYGMPDFDPLEAIEGDPKSPIWVVALNPKTKDKDHILGSSNPMNWSKDIANDKCVPHFGRLKNILGEEWHSSLLQSGGIAHTDIVKCGSPSYTKTERGAVELCKDFLFEQIKKFTPKLVLVLSSDAARLFEGVAGLKDDETEGSWVIEGTSSRCYVVLSGYSSAQQERYARRRLQRDFLAAAKRLDLWPTSDLQSRG